MGKFIAVDRHICLIMAIMPEIIGKDTEMADDRDERGRFLPGNSASPGRPRKGQALTDVLREKVSAEQLAEKLVEMVHEGNLGALKYIYDRIDGRPKETVENIGADGGPVEVRVIFEHRDTNSAEV